MKPRTDEIIFQNLIRKSVDLENEMKVLTLVSVMVRAKIKYTPACPQYLDNQPRIDL